MNNGDKERLDELERRSKAAKALGHGILELPLKRQAAVADDILADLPSGKSRLDFLLAMHARDIPVSSELTAEYRGVVEAKCDLERRRKEYAAAASAKKRKLAEFEEWLKQKG